VVADQYLFPVTENLEIGAEARFSSFDRYRDQNFAFNIVLAYTIDRY